LVPKYKNSKNYSESVCITVCADETVMKVLMKKKKQTTKSDKIGLT